MWEVNRDELERLVKDSVMYTMIMYKKGIDEKSARTIVEDLIKEFIDKKEGYEWED